MNLQFGAIRPSDLTVGACIKDPDPSAKYAYIVTTVDENPKRDSNGRDDKYVSGTKNFWWQEPISPAISSTIVHLGSIRTNRSHKYGGYLRKKKGSVTNPFGFPIRKDEAVQELYDLIPPGQVDLADDRRMLRLDREA